MKWGGVVQIKTRFRGRSEHSLDSKGRLSFPSRFRDVLSQFESEELMVTNWGKHSRVYPVSEWEQLETNLLAKGKEQPELGSFVRNVITGVNECSLDKQGRLLLPQQLRNEVNLRKDVVIAGMIDWVEIWDKDAWNAERQKAQANFDNDQKKMTNLGMF